MHLLVTGYSGGNCRWSSHNHFNFNSITPDITCNTNIFLLLISTLYKHSFHTRLSQAFTNHVEKYPKRPPPRVKKKISLNISLTKRLWGGIRSSQQTVLSFQTYKNYCTLTRIKH